MQAGQVLSGQAIVGEELALRPVDIVIEGDRITAIEENPRAPPVWICPAFFNAHTHLGDTIAMDCGSTGDLVSLVTPPDGLKHRLLAAATKKDLTAGMRASVTGMIRSGTLGCADFREGGREGVLALRDAVAGLTFRPVIFGRGGGEDLADGLGVSSTRDVPGVEEMIRHARNAGKKIAFHAGERDRGDIDAALSFEPDLLIHMTHATKRQLRACAEQEIPIVVCPRSNWVLGVTSSARHPPVRTMIELGCTLLLGTDNVMFIPPDMFSEMAFLSTIYHLDPRVILRSAVAGSELTRTPFFIRKGARAAFFTFDPAQSALVCSRDPVASLVKRAQTGMRGNNVFNLKTQ
ncbi:amidohydrolase [Methanoregula boonei 6A8]|uniref:Amidohydrolase n=1 Tax=Methanoregula boonei (strain DSM 21154 / JCM 14090 / 6A8) TaxID=456442 RepID=A7I838_METB6|nr:amidohydrolase family protein [Methanoregula boonei]ABS55899.1 amidohydrolase [Methanoregula boonei 6A8]